MAKLSDYFRYVIFSASILAPLNLSAAANDAWPAYGNDNGGTKFSPLAQINTANVSKLKLAWSYDYAPETTPPESTPGRNWSMTPIVIDDVMYFSTPSPTKSVVALNATTGHEIWSKAIPGGVAGRGLAYWKGDKKTPPRLVFTVSGGLMQLDAGTGDSIKSFGVDGVLAIDANLPTNLRTRMPNPVSIYDGIAIVGANTNEGAPPGPRGDIRAWDLRTGKLAWTFHTIPKPNEPGFETWPDAKSVENRPGANVWSMFTVDDKRGLVFAPIGSPGYDFYGADRKGDNLYGNSIVALDARTGKLRWHFQMVHHDLNDYDGTGAPSLIEVRKGGRPIPAVAQSTKMGLIFILDRETGKPIFGVEERPIPQSELPGEHSSPTQPFPLKPPPLARMTMTRDEVMKLNPESEKFCTEFFDRLGPAVSYRPGRTTATLNFPGTNGGSDWGGVSFNPKLGYIFANITNVGTTTILVKQPDGSPMGYRNESAFARFVDKDRYPCQIGPWGELAAINANTGDIAWKVPLGSYAELEAKGLKDYGAPNLGGSLSTAGDLVFIGATNDRTFRAFDAKTGKVLWTQRLEASGNATPISFKGKNGKQYVAITSSGPGNWRNVGPTAGDRASKVLVFSLP